MWAWPSVPNKFDWNVLVVVAVISIIWGALAGFDLPSVAISAAMSSLLLLGCAGVLKARASLPFFSALFGALAWVSASAIIMSHASYVWASANFPLVDPMLTHVDEILGIDKRLILEMTGASWWLSQASLFAYHKTAYELFLGFAVLMVLGDYKRVADTLSILTVCIVATLSLSTVAPAVGAFVELTPTPQMKGYLNDPIIGVWHLEHLNGLRDGSRRTFPATEWQGLVTFPSFHTLYALTASYALAKTRYLAWPAAFFSGFVVFTTLPIGGHYFFDLVASFVIFAAAVYLIDANARHSVNAGLREFQSRALRAVTA